MKKNQKEKRKQAIALSYDLNVQHAPKVVATGKGIVADNILERAKEHHVPVQEDPDLVELLGQLNINESIPEELYGAVAEVFAFIYRTNEAGKNGQKDKKRS